MAISMIWFALVVGAASQNLPQLTIDLDKLSVSGVSSGGAMAIQVCLFLWDRRNDHALADARFVQCKFHGRWNIRRAPLLVRPSKR